jgi:putative heme-binding domain-containing protein
VRLAIISALQRFPAESRTFIASMLDEHPEDNADHNLPLMLWYSLIPVCDKSPSLLADLGAHCKISITRKLIARRIGTNIDAKPDAVNSLVAAAKDGDDVFAADILNGLSDGFVGKRKAAKPADWDSLAAKISAGNNATLKDRVRELSVFFGDGRALDELKSLALNSNAELNNRKAALSTLIESKPADLREICEKLMGTRFLNSTAARGLALFDDPKAGEIIAKNYKNFHPTERPQAVEVLLARASFAHALLDAVAAGQIARTDITPFNARQIRNLGDEALAKRLAEVWGEMRESDAERKQMLAKLKTSLSPDVIAKADLSQGRLVFQTTCATCHKLYGEGGQIGPDLTGAGRDNMDYLLENIGDPSAVVSADFRMSIVALNDGRVFNGIITSKTDKMMTLQTMTEKLTVETSNLKRIKESSQSLMPEGLIEALKPEQVRDLFAYLMHRGQVPLPEGAGKK